jgi:hypothetical protein
MQWDQLAGSIIDMQVSGLQAVPPTSDDRNAGSVGNNAILVYWSDARMFTRRDAVVLNGRVNTFCSEYLVMINVTPKAGDKLPLTKCASEVGSAKQTPREISDFAWAHAHKC